ncbi:hypothetical protein [Actinomadura rugatobispora]|uniref:Uncharacterized protein n=1 Tax=Actinomadura rugatobispora TaxID=1994 RepID=A0ABW0ZVW2_9ACTN|nr:hypothetical protein GCM10010200_056700 [Actinomadura rugatobispora]
MNTEPRGQRAVRRGALAAVAAAALVLLFGFAAPAQADDNPSTIANGLASSRLYVTQDARGQVTIDQNAVLASLNGSPDADIRAVVVRNGVGQQAMGRMLVGVKDRVDKGDTYVAITADGTRMTGISKMFDSGEINRLIARSDPGSGNAQARLTAFAGHAEQQADAKARSGTISGFVTLSVVVLIMAGAFGAFLVAGKRRREREARQMAELKKGVEEDVILLGEDIAALDLDVMDHGLDPDTRRDYERAMNSYDDAKTATDRAARPTDMEDVTTALENGRYYMTATRARLAGEEVPQRRAPCFFNPQHGPSVKDVTWAPPGGVARSVPACDADAQRVLKGQDPDVRLVPYGDGRRPYYDAGPAYAPYAGGYYASYGGLDLLSGMMIGTMLGSMMSGGFGGGYADAGAMSGFGGDGGDVGGGWDFGGGDFGGGF